MLTPEEIARKLMESMNKEIEVNVLESKSVDVEGKTYRILKLDAISMAKVQQRSIGLEGGKVTISFEKNMENLIKYATDGLDAEEYLKTTTYGEVNKLLEKINKFNGISTE